MYQISEQIELPTGFKAGAGKGAIKADRLDVALMVSEPEANAGAVFTRNKVFAAPVVQCREALADSQGRVRAVVVNSGCANACTGDEGLANARRMATIDAKVTGAPEVSTLACSTGTIGIQLPMDRVEAGILAAAADLSDDGLGRVARAIMTTDTCPKSFSVVAEIAGVPVTVTGLAKGSGMIEPNMATMLAYVMTDAAVSQPALQAATAQAAELSFNSISVDGDMSTNDTLLVLANGAAGGEVLTPGVEGWDLFEQMLQRVCAELAKMIVRDGEGATKFVTISVTGAASDADAALAAKAVARSLLVKTAFFGGDPNWGRIISAVGYSGADVDQDRVQIAFDGKIAVVDGVLSAESSLAELEKVYAKPEFDVQIDLKLGTGARTVYTCDCSYDYVKINAEYMT
jgi:glutamate N-acetyltransferase/amino-acid N-acetyltransferase